MMRSPRALVFLLLSSLFFFLPTVSLSQEFQSPKISGTYQEADFSEVLEDWSDKYQLNFFYRLEWIENKRITQEFDDLRLSDALNTLLRNQSLTFILRAPNNIILLADKGTVETTVNNPEKGSFITIGELNLNSDNASLRGSVMNGENGFPMPGVIVSVKNTDTRVVTDDKGDYSFALPPDTYEVVYHHQTMEDIVLSIALNGDGRLNVNMYEDVLRLEEVIIQEEAVDQNVSETITGQEYLNIETIKRIPAFFGEVDIINSVLSLPGVTRVGEGTSGYNVRGGSTGQNLILIDNATIYNPSHLFGFFSSFNPDVVNSVEFFKGSIPAKYGGRIASVLDVDIKTGNKQAFEGQGGVGLINSRFSIEGPIQKDTTSFVFGVRGGYPNYIIRQLEDLQLSNSAAYFLDGNLKIDHLINAKNRVSASGYFSRDNFKLSDEAEYDYGNKTVGVEWNTTLKSNMFMDVQGTFSAYDFTLTENEDPQLAASLDAAVKQITGQVDVEKELNPAHRLGFGGSFIRYEIEPGIYRPVGSESIIAPLTIDSETGIESALYLSDQYRVNNTWSIYAGLRFSFYNGGKKEAEITNYGLEPRLSVNLRTSSTASVKMGYNRMRQYVHFISNTTAATPIDLWKLSNETLLPTIGDQVTLGYFKNFKDNMYETSIEAFYKKTQDLVEYKNGAELFVNPDIEEELLQGEGEAYGVEFFLKKLKGPFQGWISYTFSRSFIDVPSTRPNEGANTSVRFPTNFDTPHNFSAFGTIQLTRRFSANANFQYNTGRPITYPESVYEVNGVIIPNYSTRNAYRIPDYHRLDLSFTMASTLKRNKKLEANWTLSIYNLYGRKNAYSVYFKNDPDTGLPQAFKLSVIGRPIVAITYNFKF